MACHFYSDNRIIENCCNLPNFSTYRLAYSSLFLIFQKTRRIFIFNLLKDSSSDYRSWSKHSPSGFEAIFKSFQKTKQTLLDLTSTEFNLYWIKPPTLVLYRRIHHRYLRISLLDYHLNLQVTLRGKNFLRWKTPTINLTANSQVSGRRCRSFNRRQKKNFILQTVGFCFFLWAWSCIDR